MQSWDNLFRRRASTARSGWNLLGFCMIGMTMLLSGARSAQAQVVFSEATGHYYEAVAATSNWADARDAAALRTFQGMPGHLVTITSAAEQTFVNTTFPIIHTNDYWIGAYQDTTGPNFSEPGGGWHWVTGELWSYTAWNSGEPNNNGGIGPSESYVIFAANGSWNDFGTATTTAKGYIVEYEKPRQFFDINRDGYADIVFQNSVTNQVSYWAMKGTSFVEASATTTTPAAGFALRGVGDFNNDGNADLVFQNTTTGQVALWFLNGTGIIAAQSVDFYPAAGYQVVSVGDFNADGQADLVFQNVNTGQIAVWYMNGAAIVGAELTQAKPSADYHVVGSGDFNGDGKPDLVFQNVNTGLIVVWYMNGAQYQSGAVSLATPSASYKVVGINDYNNDGQPDLLFQNASTGQLALWYMTGVNFLGGGLIGPLPASNNTVVGPR